MLKSIVNLMIYTKNKQRLVDFYHTKLGLDLKNPNDEMSRLYLPDGMMTIGFRENLQVDEELKNIEITFQVDSVEKTCARLKQKGIIFVREATKIGKELYVANFNDPDGNRLAILSFGSS